VDRDHPWSPIHEVSTELAQRIGEVGGEGPAADPDDGPTGVLERTLSEV
jgi:hypothetical protein